MDAEVRNPRDKSLYRAVNKLSPKAEKLREGTVNGAFVDAGHLDRVHNNTNQYIEGRRGTGKTHLLLYLTGLVNGTLMERREAAVYVDVRELHVESGKLDRSPDGTARRVFRELLSSIESRLRELDSSVLFHNSIPVERDPWERQAMERSREALAKLREAAGGRAIQTSKQGTTESSLSSTVSEVRGAQLSLDNEMRVAGKLGVEEQSAHEAKSEVRQVDVFSIDFREVRRAIEAFLSANSLELLYLNLDEWSSLPLEAQPLFAEYLKRAFAPSKSIVMKIAVLPYQTKLNRHAEGGRIEGLEKQGDIYLGLDLDNEFVFGRHPERSLNVLARLLHNHLRFIVEEVDGAEKAGHLFDTDPASTVEWLFSVAAFRRLLVFSQGNPRDFLALFRAAYISFYDKSQDRIGTPLVEGSAKELGIEKLENIRENDEAYSLFNEIISRVLQREKKSAFMVNASRTNHPLLGFLIHQRVLHVWDKSYSSPNAKGERFLVVAIDHSVIAEHLRSPNYRGLMELPFSEEARQRLEQEKEDLDVKRKLLNVEKPDKRTVRYTLIDDSIFDRGRVRICSACDSPISPEHPVFLKHGCCPSCGEMVASSPADAASTS